MSANYTQRRSETPARRSSPFRSDGIGTGLYLFILTRFLHANRYPLRSKTLSRVPSTRFRRNYLFGPHITSTAPADDGVEFGARHLRAGANRDGMERAGGEQRQRLRIGRGGELAALLRPPEDAREEAVGFDEPGQHQLADGRIEHRFRGRRHHREAAARAVLAGQIHVERDRIDAEQHFAQRQIERKRFAHPLPGAIAVTLVALDVELALVAERAIEARPVHACGRREIVERGRGKAFLPEHVERARQRHLRLIGARPAAALRRGGRANGLRRLCFWRLLVRRAAPADFFFVPSRKIILDARIFMRNGT